MKKIMMLVATAATILTSCSNSELVDLSAGKAIGFETYVGKTTSRGVPVSGVAFADASTMKVWGYSSTTQMTTTFGSPTILPNLEGATVTKGAGNWTYSPLAYWKDGFAHSFFACAPSVTDGVQFAAGKFTYTVQDLVDNQVDFMVADPIKNTVWDGTADPIKQVFTFHHALSQIKYSVKITADSEKATGVTVKSIMIQNLDTDGSTVSTLATTGEIDAVARTNASADIAYTGTATGTVDGYTVTPTTPVTLAAATTTPNFVDVKHKTDDVLMLLPQTTTGKVKFTIVLGYNDSANAPQTAEAYFITSAAQTWAPNKIYLYKFEINMPQVLNQKPIEFGEPTIVDWDTTANEVTPGQQ